jgi:glutamate N-acetyltransferase/amino-acid N-acetyltransferase
MSSNIHRGWPNSGRRRPGGFSNPLLLFATGKSGAPKISRADDPRPADFRDKLERVLLDLAHQLVRDGDDRS